MGRSIKKTIANGCRALLLPILLYLVFYALAGSKFGGIDAFLIIARQSVVPILLAFSVTSKMTMQMWDFSAGAVMITSAIFGGSLAVSTETGLFGFIVTTVLIAVVLSLLSGFLYSFIKIPILVLTLGLCLIYETLPRLLNGNVFINAKMSILSKSPWCFLVLFLAAAVFYIIYYKKPYGGNVRAIGANQQTAAASGLKLNKTKNIAFGIGGVYVGLAAVLYLSANSTLSPPNTLSSLDMLFDAMMGVFLAFFLERYCNLVFGVIIGCFSIKILVTGLVALGIDPSIRDIATGFFMLVLLAISMNRDTIAQWRENKELAQHAKTIIQPK